MPSPRRLTLLHKGLLLIAIPLVYQAVLLGALITRQQTLLRAQGELVETKNALLQLDGIFTRLLRSQADLRGYLLTGYPAFRDSSSRAALLAREEVNQMAASVPKHSQRAERLPVLRDLIAERIAYANEIFQMVDQGKREDAIARVRQLEGQQLMDKVQREVEALRAREEQLDQVRTRELHDSSRFQNLMLIGGLVLNVVLGTAATLYFSKTIGVRIEVVSENMRRIARGETLPPRVGGTDEIGELDNGLHDMAAELDKAHESERITQLVLEKRNVELTRANRELDHKNQENEMFVYSVSHDLRSPLVNLQGFSKELGLVRDDLQQLFDGELNEKARVRGRILVDRDVTESIHYIQTAVTRLSAIIDALLRLSRAGRVEYQPETVDLTAVVRRIVAAMRSSIEQHAARVTVQELPSVWGDATALEQIFANLIGNAVNYLSPERSGYIEVGVAVKPPEDLEDMQVYCVRDNGLGIAEAYLPKVFAIFQRLHASVVPGEGIGLALVRRMVERHGGKIWVESKEGEGSVFFVALPRKEDSPLIVAPKKERIRVSSPNRS